MIRRNVSSSSLRTVGYDAANEALEITFTSNSIYLYFNVPMDVYEDLMAAPSQGRFFAQYIKNQYGFYRVR